MSTTTARDAAVSALMHKSGKGCNIVVIGTCDSKLQELLLLRQCILDCGAGKASLIDVGRTPQDHEHITIKQDVVAQYSLNSGTDSEVTSLPRGELVIHMSKCATLLIQDVYESAGIHGIVSAGGSGGTSLVAPVMRQLPIGFPKLLVSTVASGDTGPIVEETDITMMYSVVDIAGTNTLLESIFENAAGSIVGMAQAYQRRLSLSQNSQSHARKRIGITMFGVTTPCVNTCRRYLEDECNCEVFVFHATGHGGKAMERLVQDRTLDAILDVTTTEICDHLMGGNMSAGPHRLEAAAKAGIPCVVSLGATSMVNFGPKTTVPEKYAGRHLYEHNPTVTLMRTSSEECRVVGNFITEQLKKSVNQDKVQVVLPLGGVCMLSTPGGPFADSDADRELFDNLETGLKDTAIKVVRDDREINNEGFAIDISKRLISLLT